MAESTCCANQDMRWTQQIIDGQYADVYYCASCSTTHRAERYAVPLRFPMPGRCVNCGGDRPETAGAQCNSCGKTTAEDRALHDQFTRLHPKGGYLRVAKLLAELDRMVLALKLATAETQWGEDPVSGMVLRLQILDALGLLEQALDQAYEWADYPGAPTLVHGVIAGLEASAGNVDGAIKALERGLSLNAEDPQGWTDYAELMLHREDRQQALRAAAKGLRYPDTRERCLGVVLEIAHWYNAHGEYPLAIAACSVCGDLQETKAELAWLRAQIAVAQEDVRGQLQWLKATVAVDPSNAMAQDMLRPLLRNEGRKGWFW